MIRYNAEQKAQALARANEIGVRKASEELNISYATIISWRKASKAAAQEVAQPEVQQPVDLQPGLSADEKLRYVMFKNQHLIEENQRLKNALRVFTE